MYRERVPTYLITLPCGSHFRSSTPPIADEAGVHSFWCVRCADWHHVLDESLQVAKPRKVGGSRALSDKELAKYIDMAIIKDRVVAEFRATWGDVTAEQIAERHGVSRQLVVMIGVEIGLFQARPDAGSRWDKIK